MVMQRGARAIKRAESRRSSGMMWGMQEVTASGRPNTNPVSQSATLDRWRTYPADGLTPRKLAALFRAADGGDIYSMVELATQLEERDGQLAALLGQRYGALAARQWKVKPGGEGEKYKQHAEFAAQVLRRVRGFAETIKEMDGSVFYGFAAHGIQWVIRNAAVEIAELPFIPHRRFTFLAPTVDDTETDPLVTGTPRLLTKFDPTYGIELEPNRYILNRSRVRTEHGNRSGLIRPLAWLYLISSYSLKDWMAFAEVYGFPFRVGRYPANTGEEDQKRFLKALIDLGRDSAAVIDDRMKLDIHDLAFKASSSGLYQDLVAYADAVKTKLILGHTSASDPSPGDFGAGEQMAMEVRHDILVSDGNGVAGAVSDQCIRPLIEYNFGPQDVYPQMVFDTDPPINLKSESEIDRTLIVDIGLPVAVDDVYNKYGWRKPEKGDEILEPPSSMPSLPFDAPHGHQLSEISRRAMDHVEQLRRYQEVKKKRVV